LGRSLVVNKIDHDGIDLEGLVEALRDEFGIECLPINLPAQGGTAVVDCFFQPAGEADFSSVASAHQQIIDQVVEINESVMGRYLDEANRDCQARNCTMRSSSACARATWCRSASSRRAAAPA